MIIENKNFNDLVKVINFAGRDKMTNGSMIFLMMMNLELLVWIDCVIIICKYKLLILLDAISSFYGF